MTFKSFVRIVSVAVAALVVATRTGISVSSQSEDRIVTTEHQAAVDGKTLRYTARAGRLPILDNETGEVHARMFFVAYAMARGASDPPRPLTFLWNGGPGSSSSLVHLIGFGPQRLGPSGPIANAGTWLDFTDLVFIDPVGTGYSRPTKAEYGAEFYQTRGDAESVAEFIRVYRNRFDAHDAPLFLAGESYGVTRAAGVADVLERRGMRLNGAILIGLALPLGELRPEQRSALNAPTYTAAAFANKKLAADLQGDLEATLRKAESWASTAYLSALARRDALTDVEREQVVTDLARFTGFDASLIDRKTLAIPMPQFSEQLLRAENRIVGRYNSRLTAPFDSEQQKMYDPTKDPSLVNIIDDVAVLRYMRSTLKYESDLKYQGPFGGGYPPPTAFRGDWMSVRWDRQPAAAAPGAAPTPARESTGTSAPEQPLRRALAANPSLRVMSSCGYYDLVCSYFANEWVAARLDPEIRSRVSVRNYGGPHAVYDDAAVRIAMKRDVAAFVQSGTARPAPAKRPPAAAIAAGPEAEAVETTHQVSVGGKPLRYTARAGLLPIRVNDTGDTHGRVFYTAYTLQTQTQAKRPLTFLWNGGPGSNSVLLHLFGFGPRRIRTSADASGATACECELQDNDATWLEQSDLVFVDPVGTGFSRPTRAEYGAEFYNTFGDIASIAEFVRVYRTRFDAWDAPIFIAGESYGSWRAAGVAEALERRGERVAGVMLISGGIPVGPVIDEEMRTALFIPTRTAAAFHHKRLDAELQKDLQATLRQVEEWAHTEYGPALKRVATLTDVERQRIVAALSRFTGLDRSLIDSQTLIVGRQQFAEQLLRADKRVLARFDTRDVEGAARASERNATVNQYFRSTLGFKIDLAYQGAEDGFTPSGQRVQSVGARWNYNQGVPPPPGAPPPPRLNLDAPPGGAQPWLRRAMAINPTLTTFVVAGLYDSLNSCAVNAHLVAQLEPALKGQITEVCYPGGHMMYDEPAVRVKMTREVAAFIQRTLSNRTAPVNRAVRLGR
ncbi:MAG: S10 family serine carboxypeptidase-like protein [Vicinamibacterales bacterium]